MQASEHVFIEGKPHDARWAETLGLSDLLAFVNIGPGDPAGIGIAVMGSVMTPTMQPSFRPCSAWPGSLK